MSGHVRSEHPLCSVGYDLQKRIRTALSVTAIVKRCTRIDRRYTTEKGEMQESAKRSVRSSFMF